MCCVHRFTGLTENSQIFSSCGTEDDKTGLSVYYSRKRLYAVVSTRSQRWTVYTRRVTTQEYVKYSMSWSQQQGLAIYVNGDRDQSEKKPTSRGQALNASSNCDLLIGQTGGVFSTFVLELINIVYLHQETINEIGITTGIVLSCV